MDISRHPDLSTGVACVQRDEDFLILPQFFCPADSLRARADRDGVPHPAWAEQGHIIPTPGNVIDYRASSDDEYPERAMTMRCSCS